MILRPVLSILFFFNDTATTEIYTLSLHDALPIYQPSPTPKNNGDDSDDDNDAGLRTQSPLDCLLVSSAPCPFFRSEEHTSELQSRSDLVCRLLLEKKKNNATTNMQTHQTAQRTQH